MRSTKILIVLLLSIVGTSVLADTGDYFALSSNDQSIYYLQWFFGDVGGVFGVTSSSDQQFLGTLMRYLNLGILSFATLMITYTILMGVVKTAQDAAFMGREGKSGWTAIRSALGIALLVPGTTGYSLIQVFIMWVVVQGVGLADTIFIKAAKFLDAYDLPKAPGSSGGDEGLTANYPQEAIKYGPKESMVPMALSVISSKLCSRYFNEIVDENLTALKSCISLQQTTQSQAVPSGIQTSASANSTACSTLFEKWGIPDGSKEKITDSLTTYSSDLLSLLNKNLSPRVAFYLGYKDKYSEDTSTYVYTSTHPALDSINSPSQDRVNKTMPYAVAGIKLPGKKIVAVCGAYPIGKAGQVVDRFSKENYSQMNTLNFSAFKAMSDALNATTNSIYNQTAKDGTRLKRLGEEDVGKTGFIGSFRINTIGPAVNGAIKAWRRQTATNIETLEQVSAELNLDGRTVSTINLNNGWILAGGYYWLMSKFEGNRLDQITKKYEIFPLCSYKTSIASDLLSVTSNRHNGGTSFPIGCEDATSIPAVGGGSGDSGDASAAPAAGRQCRQVWNRFSTNSDHAMCTLLSDIQEFQSFVVTHLGQDSVAAAGPSAAHTSLNLFFGGKGGVLESFKHYTEGVNDALKDKKDSINSMIESDKDALDNLNNSTRSAADTEKLYKELAAVSGLIGVIGTGLIIGASAAGGVIAGAVTGCAVAIILAGFISVAELFKISPNTDPMTILFNMGHALSALAITSYIAAGAAIYYFAIGTGTMNSMHGISEANKLSLSWFAPLFQVVVIAAMANGGMLSIYVPMIPLMIYLFAVMGWLITVLEAMVAGPLIAMGVTHPQGHDLLGKSEQAMMMLISVFLRPALITIGFFASMLMLRVSFNIARAMLTPYSDMFTLSSMNPVIGIAFFMTLTVIVIGVIETAFSLINVIPERVMHWIGVQGMAQDLSRATMQMVQGATKAAGQSAGESMTRQGQNEEKKSLQGSEGSASARDN